MTERGVAGGMAVAVVDHLEAVEVEEGERAAVTVTAGDRQLARHHGIEGAAVGDRKSVVEGKSVSVRVDLGGSRIIKKKNTHATNRTYKCKANIYIDKTR